MSFEEIGQVVVALRNQWVVSDNAGKTTHTALAVLHGLAERAAFYQQGVLTPTHFNFFSWTFDLVKAENVRGVTIEREARKLGLHVCCPEDNIRDLRAYFGSVEGLEGHYARIILLDAEEISIGHDGKVPLLWLPKAYREEGAGIAWIERVCDAGSVGRFEPASTMD